MLVSGLTRSGEGFGAPPITGGRWANPGFAAGPALQWREVMGKKKMKVFL